MENTLKIKVFRMSILFCKYLPNGSSDLYKFYVVVYYYLVSLYLKCQKDLCTNACAEVVYAHSCDKTCLTLKGYLDLLEKIVSDASP